MIINWLLGSIFIHRSLLKRPVNLSNHVTNVCPSISIFRCKKGSTSTDLFFFRRIQPPTWVTVETAFFVFRTLPNCFAQHPKRSSKPKSWIFSRDSLILAFLIIARGTLPALLLPQPIIKSIQQDGAFQVRSRLPFCIGCHHNSVRIENQERIVGWGCERQRFTMVMDEFHSLSLQITVKLKFLYQECM